MAAESGTTVYDNLQIYGKRTILGVDDNEINREILCEMLKPYYTVILAKDGRAALDILEQKYQEISAVLLDIQMPVMDGYEFLRTVKKNAMLASIPVIVMTASTDRDEEEKCLNLGAADFIPKPYEHNSALKRIEGIIRLRESAATLSAVEYDDLTGLLTRQAFFHHAQQLLRKNPDIQYDITVSDIEDFRMVNEIYGEEMGDKVLCYFADFLKMGKKDGILAARFGSDQFVTLLEHRCREGISQETLNQICSELVDNSPVPHILGKCGVYENVDHNLPVSILCDRAMMALRTIKHQYGKIFAEYNADLQKVLDRRRHIEKTMESGLTQQQFRVYYQPKHDTKTGELVGAEALVRWHHPEFGFISPTEFVPQFERNGFITKMDSFVWEQVCRALAQWSAKGIDPVPISVNASRRDFFGDRVVEHFMKPVIRYNVKRSLLHIEVTESFYQKRADEMIAIVKSIRDTGFKIELDDFGSGYSSLGLLKKLPVDVIKLDASFVQNLENQADIIEIMVAMAGKLGCKTIMEGVDTKEQLDTIAALGCDYVQGFCYSEPLPEEEFEEYLRTYRK